MKNLFPSDIISFLQENNLNISEDDLDYYDVDNNIIYNATILDDEDIWIHWFREEDGPYLIMGSFVDSL